MSIAKHTPGPWCIDDNGQIRAQDNDAIIAGIDYGGTLHGRENFTPSQMVQHAKLIAAAPDMFEALKDVIAAPEEGWTLQQGLDLLQKCRAALVKAGVKQEEEH